MDDEVLLVPTKKEAIKELKKIKEFLENNLKLELNSKTQIFKNRQGVNFCGYKIKEYNLKIRDKGKRKLKRKIKELKYNIKNEKMTYKDAKKYLCGHIGYIQKQQQFCSSHSNINSDYIFYGMYTAIY